LYDEHQSQSTGLDKHGYQLYDPWPLVEGIVGGSVSIGDAESWAITRIKNIALELDRQELLMDPWGRKGKNLKGCRKYSRFAERTNALPVTSPTPASSSVPPAKLGISLYHTSLPELFATPKGAELLMTHPSLTYPLRTNLHAALGSQGPLR